MRDARGTKAEAHWAVTPFRIHAETAMPEVFGVGNRSNGMMQAIMQSNRTYMSGERKMQSRELAITGEW